jgi:methionyl-tRNA formyltransferase
LDKDIDTGRVIMQKPFDIPDTADVEYVYDGLMHLGAEICLETIQLMIDADGYPESIPQEDLMGSVKRLYEAPKLFKNNCEIDWSRPSKRIYDFIRGLSPYPGAWTTLLGPNGKTVDLKIFKTTKTEKNVGMRPGMIVVYKGELYITTGDFLLQIDELQMAGKNRMSSRDFLNGNKNFENYIIK